MGKQSMKFCFGSYILVAIYICACSCSPPCEPSSEIPTSVDDYIEHMSAHYKNEINMIEAQLTQMEMATNKELSIVAYSQELAAKTARQLESRMRSVATLNVKGKLCIQHFIGNVTTENINLQNKLRACVDAGRTGSRPIADNAKTQVRNLRAQLNDLVNADLALCRKNNGNSLPKLIECAREKLRIREINVQNMLKAVSKEIESCMCRADIVARTAQECSFIVLLETQSLLSEIVSNINTCIGDRLLEIK